MADNKKRPLTVGELRKIAEYENIAKFAEDILAGRHPRVKIPVHLRPENQPCPKPLPDNLDIDFRRDYFKDLGVQSATDVPSIEKAWRSRWNYWSPVSEEGKRGWTDANPEVRARAEKGWDIICIAHKILTIPALRSKYETGRIMTVDELIKAASDAAKVEERKQKKEMRQMESNTETPFQSQHDKTMTGTIENEGDNNRCIPLPSMAVNTLPEEGSFAVDNQQTNMTATSSRLVMYPEGPGPNNPMPEYIPASELKINPEVDYYKVLGVCDNSSTKGIHQGFVSRWYDCAPYSLLGNEKWSNENATKRRKVANDWHAICRAHQILTDPKLRAEYSSSRFVLLQEKQAAKKELDAQLRRKTHALQKKIMESKKQRLDDKRAALLDDAAKLRTKIKELEALQGKK